MYRRRGARGIMKEGTSLLLSLATRLLRFARKDRGLGSQGQGASPADLDVIARSPRRPKQSHLSKLEGDNYRDGKEQSYELSG